MYGNNAESINNKNPFFIGTVVDNNDPTFNYRVKVRLPKIHDTIPDNDLPWAARVDRAFRGIESDTPNVSSPQNSNTQQQPNNAKQSQRKTPPKFDHCVPEKGTKVLVLMIQNDANSLVYIGALYKKTKYTPEGQKYLDTYGVYADEDQFVGIDLTGDKNEIKVYFIGNVDVDKVEKIDVKAKDDITIITKNNVTVKADNNVTVECNNLTAKVKKNVNVECNSLTAKASSNATVKSPNIKLNGNVTISGNVIISGNLLISGNVTGSANATFSGDVKGEGKSLANHTHSNGNNGHPTGAPT